MQRIINNKKYSTETAKYVGVGGNNLPDNDFNYFVERLYQKRTGEFFLYYSGGPLSKYAKNYGPNEVSGSVGIRPLKYAEAQQWAEEYLTTEEYESIFGEVAEDGAKSARMYTISNFAAEKLKRAAAKKGLLPAELLEGMIKELL